MLRYTFFPLIYMFIPILGFAQSVSILDISPNSPAQMTLGEKVNISFRYNIKDRRGVHIVVRPVSGSRLTANYTASDSPIYRGSGEGNINFTIHRGTATVEQVRFQILSGDRQRIIFEFYIPVKFSFSEKSASPRARFADRFQTNQGPVLLRPDKKKKESLDINSFSDILGEEIIQKREILDDGTIKIYYSGDYIHVIPYEEVDYIITAERDTLYEYTTVRVGAQPASEPAAPPGFVPDASSETNEEWLSDLNSWLEEHNKRLLERIQIMLDSNESFQLYLEFEKANGSNLYGKIDLRYHFLTELITNNF